MRGDQLARQWRVILAIEASPNGLTVAEVSPPLTLTQLTYLNFERTSHGSCGEPPFSDSLESLFNKGCQVL